MGLESGVRWWALGLCSVPEEVGHVSSLVIRCHVIVLNIVKIRADSALFGTFYM